MLLIYTPHISNRLHYICSFIFTDVLQMVFTFTTDVDYFIAHNGTKINYSHVQIACPFSIAAHPLLFEKNIQPQHITCFKTNRGFTAFFATKGQPYPFDIFAASFYLISRYEEYLPHDTDTYGRYAHANSVAFKNNFLQLPLVNIWINDFAKAIQGLYPLFAISSPTFSFIPTYDVDMAWSYKYKGWLRTLGGFIKKPSLNRVKVWLGLLNDPFDCYNFLNKLHKDYALAPTYFFLVAKQNGSYDKNILPSKLAMQKLIQAHANLYEVGLHPSWSSYNNQAALLGEKNTLAQIINRPVVKSRQHYIKLSLPVSYQYLVNMGITADYSMGYGSINGFRASIATTYPWYNLANDKATLLHIHPFCFMDANSYYEQKQSLSETYTELLHYYTVTKNVGGQLITIFHNSLLGNQGSFKGWADMYARFVKDVSLVRE